MKGRLLNENDVYALEVGDYVILEPVSEKYDMDRGSEARIVSEGVYSNGETWKEIESRSGINWVFPDDIRVCNFYYPQ